MLESTKFGSVMDQIRGRFFKAEEFPYLDRSDFPSGIDDRLMTVEFEKLPEYSVTLTVKELEGLLRDIPNTDAPDLIERIAVVLETRFSARLIKLFFALYQEYFDKGSIQTIMARLIAEAHRRSLYPETGEFFWTFGEAEDIFEAVRTEYSTGWRYLDEFFKAYHIEPDTRLSLEIRIQCFSDASLAMYQVNSSQMTYLVEKLAEEDLKRILKNYIRVSQVKNALNEVNTLILKRMGEPSRSSKWEGYDKNTVMRFSEWCFYHHLKHHSLRYPKKYGILSKYYSNLVENYKLEKENALVMDFNKVVVVDVAGYPFSFFYEKWAFQREIEQWLEFEDPPSFLQNNKEKATARDYIIEDNEEPCLLLLYEGIDLMYIRELLDIKMGLEPDLREIKRLKSKEQGEVQFY